MSQEADLNRQLVEAAKTGDVGQVRRLIDAGADVNAPAEHGLRPLLVAAHHRHLDVVRALLAGGADVNYAGFSEGTVLVFAAETGNTELVSLLLDAGADANLALSEDGQMALHVAAFLDRKEVVPLLVRAGADVNRQTRSNAGTNMFNGGAKLWGETPLHFAAAYASPATIEALLAAGADKTVGNAHGEPPIAYAGRHLRPQEVLRLLR
jgi:ankyrin repeat protein